MASEADSNRIAVATMRVGRHAFASLVVSRDN